MNGDYNSVQLSKGTPEGAYKQVIWILENTVNLADHGTTSIELLNGSINILVSEQLLSIVGDARETKSFLTAPRNGEHWSFINFRAVVAQISEHRSTLALSSTWLVTKQPSTPHRCNTDLFLITVSLRNNSIKSDSALRYTDVILVTFHYWWLKV